MARVVIEVYGGLVTKVRADTPITVFYIDHDNRRAPQEEGEEWGVCFDQAEQMAPDAVSDDDFAERLGAAAQEEGEG